MVFTQIATRVPAAQETGQAQATGPRYRIKRRANTQHPKEISVMARQTGQSSATFSTESARSGRKYFAVFRVGSIWRRAATEPFAPFSTSNFPQGKDLLP